MRCAERGPHLRFRQCVSVELLGASAAALCTLICSVVLSCYGHVLTVTDRDLVSAGVAVGRQWLDTVFGSSARPGMFSLAVTSLIGGRVYGWTCEKFFRDG